jgi:hypothetical protein
MRHSGDSFKNDRPANRGSSKRDDWQGSLQPSPVGRMNCTGDGANITDPRREPKKIFADVDFRTALARINDAV